MLLIWSSSTGQQVRVSLVTAWRDVFGTGFGGEHSFMQEHDGRPVTYAPCQPIRLVVNDALEPAGATGLVAEAAREVSDASGLAVYVVGSTDEVAAGGRYIEGSVYGDGWAPVLVVWTSPEQDPGLVGDPMGTGGSYVEHDAGGRPWYVTGRIALDAPVFERVLTGEGGRDRARAVIMHELGHVLGLGHVDDELELMAAEGAVMTEFGPGDLEGFSKVAPPCDGQLPRS
jgi:hypothetical protein